MTNSFAHCISKLCDKYSHCLRALPSNSNIDYLKVDEDECSWYYEYKEDNNGSENNGEIERVDEISEVEDEIGDVNI